MAVLALVAASRCASRMTVIRVVGPIEYVHRDGCPAEGEVSTDGRGRIWRCRDCRRRTRIIVDWRR